MTTEQTYLYIYVACMAAGALLFSIWARDPKGVHREEYLVAILIPVWSGLAYLAMASGLGTVEIAGQTTYWARYVDWVVTTPLLLVALFLTATHRLRDRPYTLLAALVAADVVMIACGAVGDLSTGGTRMLFFLIGCAALVVVFLLAWFPLRRLAATQGADLERVYTIVLAYLSVCWIGYPTIWYFGPSGIGAISQPVETILFVALPVFSKVGFSILDLFLLRRLSPTRSHNPALEEPGMAVG